ncbi:MAG: SDR family oxidoreductase [Thermoanaerobaculia bacterium]
MSILVTGFPGFLGSRLVPRIAARTEGRILCLVQPKFRRLAEARLEELSLGQPILRERVRLLDGDITYPRLGLSIGEATDLTEIFHLAAIYDLNVPRDTAMRVNLEGTRRVLEVAQSNAGLERLQYVSTCYVSGRFEGTFLESDLDKGQEFNNFYEETKYLAEVEVRKAMESGLPATIYRPAIVVGDSVTGETQKYDGPYYAIRWVVRQRGFAIMPIVGDTDRNVLNVVPSDWVIEAIDRLSGMPQAEGVTYQLADPDPLTIRELLELIEKSSGRRILKVPLPLAAAKFALDRVPGVYWLMQIPSGAIDYFVHPTRYDITNTTRDLGGIGLALPRFAEYGPRLIEYVLRHPDVPSAAMA